MKLHAWYKVNRTDVWAKTGTKKGRGECIWIHPRGRFAVLRFADGTRECFRPEEMK